MSRMDDLNEEHPIADPIVDPIEEDPIAELLSKTSSLLENPQPLPKSATPRNYMVCIWRYGFQVVPPPAKSMHTLRFF